MLKINYKNLYKIQSKVYKELMEALAEKGIAVNQNYFLGKVEVRNIKLEKCEKDYLESVDRLNTYIQDKNKTINTQENHISQLVEEYNDLENDYKTLSDKYFTLRAEYDDLSNECAELYQALMIKFNTYKEYIKLTEKNKNN